MPVNIICIDTALSTCSVAIANGSNLLGYAENLLPNTASEQINQLINEALSQAKLKLRDMQVIAISNGPGSYTGLRIGAAVAMYCLRNKHSYYSTPNFSNYGK